jgi:hypothetical protein
VRTIFFLLRSLSEIVSDRRDFHDGGGNYSHRKAVLINHAVREHCELPSAYAQWRLEQGV